MNPRLYAVLLLTAGAAQILLAFRAGRAWWLAAWSGVSYTVVAVSYLTLQPQVFGKREDGSIAWWSRVLLLPYTLLYWALWRLQHRPGDGNRHHQVAPGLWLGRRPSARELPDDIDLVVDLTCELPEAAGVLDGRVYRCLPTLDGTAPEQDAARELVRELANWPGNAYLHCAAGVGRSAVVAAATLIARGLANSPEEAERLLVEARPSVWLSPSQREALARIAEEWSSTDHRGSADGRQPPRQRPPGSGPAHCM